MPAEETLTSLRASNDPSDALVVWLRGFAYIGPLLAYLAACKVSSFDPSLYDKRKHVVACAGARRGLSWLVTDAKRAWKDNTVIARMWELLGMVQADVQAQASRELTIAALERSLCEIDKYFRVTVNGDVPKRVKCYAPATAATPARRTVERARSPLDNFVGAAGLRGGPWARAQGPGPRARALGFGARAQGALAPGPGPGA